MALFCPNKNSKEYKEMASIFGDNVTYYLWNANNGNPLDMAPNGAVSSCFQSLLDMYKGDRKEAFIAKAKLYMPSFIHQFGNWLSKDSDLKYGLDGNGEPIIPKTNKNNELKNSYSAELSFLNKAFESINTNFLFKNSMQKLMNGKDVSSKDLIQDILNADVLAPYEKQLAQVLLVHNIPVTFKNLRGKYAEENTTYRDENGNYGMFTEISIDINKLHGLSNNLASRIILHEIVHSLTAHALENAVTLEERQFGNTAKSFYEKILKLFPQEEYPININRDLYGLTDINEFVSEFLTNPTFRDLIYKKILEKQHEQKYKGFIGYLKKFIDNITRFFSKQIKNKKELNKYEKLLKDYIFNHNTINDGVISLDNAYKEIAKIFSDKVQSKQTRDEQYKIEDDFNKSFKIFTQHNRIIINTINGGQLSSQESAKNRLNEILQKTTDALSKRLVATKVSELPQEYKLKTKQQLEVQIDDFNSDLRSTFEIISDFISQIHPQILDDVKSIKAVVDRGGAISSKQYMYDKHDNFGVYLNILGEIKKIFNDKTIVQILTDQSKQAVTDNSVIKTLQNLQDYVNSAYDLVTDGNAMLDTLMLNRAKSILIGIGNEVGDATMADYINQLQYIGFDTSSFTRYIGSMDKARDNALRALYYLTSKALNTADKYSDKKMSDLLMLFQQLEHGQSQMDLYEKDKEGHYTGYLIRKLNYGQFYQDYDNFMTKLNIKYGIDPDNRKSPDKAEIKHKWEKERNAWLNEHCERKFKQKYYDAYSKLSADTLEKRREINGQISVIKEKVRGKDGYIHYDLLTDEEYGKLQQLKILQRNLKSDYDINGEAKEKNTVAYDTAKELQQLDKDLYGDTVTNPNVDIEAWRAARNKVIEECGGIEEMRKGKDGNFDFKKLKKWDLRNTKEQLKMNASGTKPLLFEDIDNELPDKPIYEIITNGVSDNGETYNKIKEEINQLLKPYKDPVTGEYMARYIPSSVKKKVKKLNIELSKIKTKSSKENKQLSKLYGKIFSKYAEFVPTEEYKKLSSLALSRDLDEPGYYDIFKLSTGRYLDIDEIIYRRDRWYSVLKPKPEYYDKYMELTPGEGWIKKDADSDLINPEFAKLQEENPGEKMIPKAALYTNKEFGKVKGNLKILYDAVYNAMKEANSAYGDAYNNYKLPSITGSMYSRIKNSNSKTSAAWHYFKDKFMVTENDTDYGQDIEQRMQEFNETMDVKRDKNAYGYRKAYGERPDGRQLNIIPRKYTSKLKDPSQISPDLINIVYLYFNSAMRYKERSKIQNDCELLVDMMQNREYYKSRIFKSKKNGEQKSEEKIAKGQSNTYNAARKFLDMYMYDIRSKKGQYSTAGVSWDKIGKLAKDYSVAINLGQSPKIAIVGLLTTLMGHLLNAMVGYRYSMGDLSTATLEVVNRFMRNGFGINYIGNKTSDDLMMKLAEHFNVADQMGRKFEHTNRNRLLNAVGINFIYGGLSMADFIAKSSIMVTVLHSYRFVDGEFMTKSDMIINADRQGKDRKEAINRWKKGDTMYSIFTVKDHKLKIDPKYEDAYKRAENIVHSRIIKWGQSADGTATELQRAAITQSFIGACILQHRQYLPLMFQERFLRTTYDYDTQEWTGGVFRNLGSLILSPLWDLMKEQSLLGKVGIGFGAVAGFGSLLAATGSLGATMAPFILYNMYKIHSKKGFDKNGIPYYVYQRQLKRLATEGILCLTIIPFFVNMLCSYADDDDDDNKALQLAAYILRCTEWEINNPYNISDIMNNFKSVSAIFSGTDVIFNLSDYFGNLLMPRSSLLNTFRTSDDFLEDLDDTVTRGAYSELPEPYNTKMVRSFIKATPFKNTFEQFSDPKSKRRYQENQIMRINK